MRRDGAKEGEMKNRIEINWFEGYSTLASLQVETENSNMVLSIKTLTPDRVGELRRIVDAIGDVLSIGAPAPTREVTDEGKN